MYGDNCLFISLRKQERETNLVYGGVYGGNTCSVSHSNTFANDVAILEQIIINVYIKSAIDSLK